MRTLWASRIGGAAQQELYLQAIESSGFTVDRLRVNAYEFISDQARNASAKYGVKSISLLATKNGADHTTEQPDLSFIRA